MNGDAVDRVDDACPGCGTVTVLDLDAGFLEGRVDTPATPEQAYPARCPNPDCPTNVGQGAKEPQHEVDGL